MKSPLFETHLKAKDVKTEDLPAAFRKASLNMALSSLVCEKAIQSISNVPRENVAFILATHFGEIESSLEFLKTYYETQMPRPILFQNSLHNSTLGFVTIHLGLTGVAMTVSSDQETEKSAYLLAESLLETHSHVMICFVDCIPEALVPYYGKSFPSIEKYFNQASCFVYSR